MKAKVEACADDLGSANDVVKQKIAEGATTVSAHTALANSERVESKVQECVDDLHEVNQVLAQGIDDLKHTETALTESRKALADTEVALATAQEGEKKAQAQALHDLHEVNETLAQGVDDLKQTEIALTESQKTLADTEAALVTAQEGEKKAELRALHDSTTGLPNRELFENRLAHAISMAERHGWTLAVLFLDLDHFKNVNDTYGHAAGDQVLKEVAKRLLQHSRGEDTVCRNGGDEFLYLLMNPKGSENIERITRAVLERIAQPIDIDNVKLVIKSSVGIAVYPDNGTSGEQLIRNADAAMYRAKRRMSGCVFFNASETEEISVRVQGVA